MAGGRYIEYARQVVAKDPMATFLGIELQEVAEAYARLSIPVRPIYCNALSRAHGMLISSLADQYVAVAAHPGQTLVGEARPVDRRRTMSLWEVRITQEERLIAVAQALTYAQPQHGIS